MHKSNKILLILIITSSLSCAVNEKEAENEYFKLAETAPIPSQIILTWQQDPSTTMTITWRTDEKQNAPTLRYAHDPDASNRHWQTHTASTKTFEGTKAWLNTVELTGLKPNTAYYVQIEHPALPEHFHFRTLPAKGYEKELVFLAGGDSRTRRDVRREMNALAIAEDPDFVIFDGDFINDALNEQEWDEWFDDWHEQLITPEGRRIPIIPAIGNHEVAGGFHQTWDQAPFYYNRFVTPSPRNYYALEIGPDMVLVTLDTDHVTDITLQTQWLDSTLYAHKNKRWKIIQWHVAAWPSVRNFNGETPVKIREHWIPVIEKHNVNLVIEAHDHAYKRTVPIRDNKQDDETGIVYIGDGGWGAPIRETRDPNDYWWLEEALTIDHFWKLTLSKDGSSLKVDPVFRPQGKSFVLEPFIQETEIN